jgi:hypothetical protein
VNLRTLRVIKKGSMPADLDGAEPPKPLPVGVQIRMHDGDLTFEWFTKTVNPPFDSRFTLTRRRAHRKPLRLLHARANAWPSGFELGSRFATWSVRVTAYGFDVKRRKRIKWTFPNAAPGEFHNPVHVAHTRRHVFFGVPVADGYELYVARRPG